MSRLASVKAASAFEIPELEETQKGEWRRSVEGCCRERCCSSTSKGALLLSPHCAIQHREVGPGGGPEPPGSIVNSRRWPGCDTFERLDRQRRMPVGVLAEPVSVRV